MTDTAAPHPALVLGIGLVSALVGGLVLGLPGAVLGLVFGMISFIVTHNQTT